LTLSREVLFFIHFLLQTSALPIRTRSAILRSFHTHMFCDVVCGLGSESGLTFAVTRSGLLCQFNAERKVSRHAEIKVCSKKPCQQKILHIAQKVLHVRVRKTSMCFLPTFFLIFTFAQTTFLLLCSNYSFKTLLLTLSGTRHHKFFSIYTRFLC